MPASTTPSVLCSGAVTEFACVPGVKERFGDAVLEQLERDGAVPMEWRAGRGRQPLKWTLTKQVRLPLLPVDSTRETWPGSSQCQPELQWRLQAQCVSPSLLFSM